MIYKVLAVLTVLEGLGQMFGANPEACLQQSNTSEDRNVRNVRSARVTGLHAK